MPVPGLGTPRLLREGAPASWEIGCSVCIVGLGRDGQQRAHSCSVLCSVCIGLGRDGI